ncbi:hypothetical protein C1Y40_03595 [Mycobacterium talmoniae]|uniref:Uncharacterized protein n=1 Tax=Mycobacterium talmoniae TaxID=1858794 RepID=A0A2S8BHY1_9MYCO|nr:hypothetical protein C1Y40_03595 [Mycobacterium talmoniae]
MVAAVDDDQVLDPAGDVELAVEVDAQVAGAEPQAAHRGAVGVTALLQPHLQLVPEHLFGLALPAPVAASDVVAVQPDLPDHPVGQLGRGLGVGDHRPLAADRLTARHQVTAPGASARPAPPVGAELLAVEVDRAGPSVGGDAGDGQGGLGHAVRRLHRGRRQPVGHECLSEPVDGRHGHRLRAVEQTDHIAEVKGVALGRQAALGGELEGEVGRGGEGASVRRFGGQLLDPAVRAPHERHRGHQRDVVPEQHRVHDHHQAHVVVQRQPADAADVEVQAARDDHLQHVGTHRPVGDLDAGRGSGRARRVLQVGDVLGVQRHRGERRPHRIRDRVDGDDAGTSLRRQLAQEGPDGLGRGGGGEHDGGTRVGQHRVEALGVAGQLRCEQRDGDVSGVDGREKANDVVDTLGRQDRHPVTRLGHLLQPRRGCPQPGPERGPGQFDDLAVALAGVVQIAIRRGVPERGDMTIQVGG